LVALKKVGRLDLAMPGAINDSLQEGFPGVFGEDGDFSKSLPALLMQKSLQGTGVSFVSLLGSSLVFKPLELFPESGEWKDWSQEVSRDLRAAIDVFKGLHLTQTGGNAELDAEERLCALTLWHRSFAQLLALKGYASPAIIEANGRTSVRALEKKRPKYSRISRWGGFLNLATGEPLVLTSSDIAHYNPAEKLIWLSRSTPGNMQDTDATPAHLTEFLSMMKGVTALFQATHPGAPWYGEGGVKYHLGDITSTKNRAVLPLEMHQLALGFLTMNFKNLAALAITKVDEQGRGVKPNQKPAGVLVLERQIGSPVGVMRIADVSALIDVVVGMHYGLKYFVGKDPSQWELLHPMYTKELLAKLLGRALFSENELLALLPSPADRAASLKDTLSGLSLPLAMAALKMAEVRGADGRAACVGEMHWDVEEGKALSSRPCTVDERSELKMSLKRLALETRSPGLLRKGESF
jgi:hypothetical protein